MSQFNHHRTRFVKPRWGLMAIGVPNTQGALRDPGLWSETPSALNHVAGRLYCRRRALSLVEVVASTLIVGMMAVAALNSLGAATRSSDSIGRRAVALGLADELMAEIQHAAYREPTATPVFGPEGAESSGPRSAFDDVDDFHGWDMSPPQYRDGTTIPDRTNWRQKVEVAYVQPANPTAATAGNTDQGAKRIKVTIEYKGQVLAEQFAIRTNSDQ